MPEKDYKIEQERASRTQAMNALFDELSQCINLIKHLTPEDREPSKLETSQIADFEKKKKAIEEKLKNLQETGEQSENKILVESAETRRMMR